MSVSIAPVTVQSASTDPVTMIAMPEFACVSTTRSRVSLMSVTDSSGTTPSSRLMISVTPSSSPTRPKTPTAMSMADGMARNA
jgi:hypothetical protein